MITKQKITKIHDWLPPISQWSREVFINEPSRSIEIFCLCSGKTASTSLFNSFAALGYNVMHVHSTQYFLSRIVRKAHVPYAGFSIIDFINYSMELSNKPIIVIDVFRDPIERKISAFFQGLQRVFMKKINNIYNEELSWLQFKMKYFENINDLIEIFNKYFLLFHENYYAHDEWTLDGYNFDLYPFDSQMKYSRYEHRNKFYFLLRFDDLKNWSKIFRRYGFDNFSLATQNISSGKDYSGLYQRFRENFFFPSSIYPEIMFNHLHFNKYRLFLSSQEMNILKAKWEDKVIGKSRTKKLHNTKEDYKKIFFDFRNAYKW